METAVRDTSLMALEKVNKRLEPDQLAVLELLEEIGPAHDLRILEALNLKEQKALKPREFKRVWKINQVTARRNELVELRIVNDIGVFKGIWDGEKKTYHFWAAQGDYRQPAGWERLPDKPHKTIIPDRCVNCEYLKCFRRQKTEKPIIEKLKVSEAGSVLGKFGHSQSVRNVRKQHAAETATLFE